MLVALFKKRMNKIASRGVGIHLYIIDSICTLLKVRVIYNFSAKTLCSTSLTIYIYTVKLPK